jgi:Flp pilus assembly pilin Flp
MFPRKRDGDLLSDARVALKMRYIDPAVPGNIQGGFPMTDLTNKMYIRLSGLWSREDGQTMAEYGIILVVVAVVAAGAFLVLQQNITQALGQVSGLLGDIVAGP